MLIDKVAAWDADEADGWQYGEHYSYLQLAERNYVFGYEPTATEAVSFLERLELWVSNVPDDTRQRDLFRLTSYLHFVGQRELDASFRFAFESLVPWWLIETLGIALGESLPADLTAAVDATWFCGITDSLLIARFHHLNQLEHRDQRPDWRTLATFGDPDRIAGYMRDRDLVRLVLLEDFVGTGSQAREAIDFAVSLECIEALLVVPLIVCDDGHQVLSELAAQEPKVTYEPVHVIPRERLLRESTHPDEPADYETFRELVNAMYIYIRDVVNETDRFGYKGTGALTVLYSNCPNNTISIVHQSTALWRPLFPRTIRK